MDSSDDAGVSGNSRVLAPPSAATAAGAAAAAAAEHERGPYNEDADPEAPPLTSCRTVSFDASHETHYVVVVHGTFDAPPADGSRTWYQPAAPGEQNFCSKIGALLADGPLGGGCVWRELPSALPARSGIPHPFHWDGTNTHEGRVDAAHKLSRIFNFIATNDPSARIHVIAHSHGGNVLLKATELYMKRLGSRSVSDLPPAVQKQFWAAYKSRYDMIRHWRKPDVSNTLWRFFPFLVVRRSMTGQRATSVKEQYPWACSRWVDSLLALPTKRQRLFLAHRLATSPLSNALGSLIFLGTPFYVKKWERNGVALLLGTTAVSMVVMFVVMWGYVLLWQLVVLASAGRIGRSESPTYVPFALAMAVLIFAIISVAMELWRSTAFYSGNIYHAPDFDWSHAMSALVVHAGKLDEASLALSTEPIARAYVFPQLASMLKLPFWKSLPHRPVTKNFSDWTLYLSNSARILLWNIIFILPAAAVALLSRLLAPVVISVVRNVIVTISFGLSAKELSFASVFVDEHLDLGLSSQHIEHWNVQKLLALAKTRSLQGELMAGYEDDTCDMGEAVFGEGATREGVPAEGVTGEGATGKEEKAGERKGQEGDVQLEEGGREEGEREEGEREEGERGEGESEERGRMEGEVGAVTGSGRRSLSRFRRRVTFSERSARHPHLDSDGGKEAGTRGEGTRGGEGTGGEKEGHAEARLLEGGGGSSEGVRNDVVTVNMQQQEHQHNQKHQEQQEERLSPGQEMREAITREQGTPRERLAYEFLWDDGALEAAARQSETYKLLRPQMQAITHNPRLSDEECVRQVKQLCVMIEERFGELTGRFDLNHGAYFRDPRILGAVAHFLGNRELPHWSREVDTDVLRAEERVRFGRFGMGS
ncbi:hypothetical protein CLOM_g15364 [Closterium sp. NIES-68]|nr:hypothetical protein CLOM_g15364 [Closterium sp. NIES-68]GJP86606.1 hypothetical protein CLOP_g16608 [Closterium sp. NIES-67]